MNWRIPFLLGGAAVLAAQAAAGLLYIGFGGFDIAASVPHNRLTYEVTHTVMEHSVKVRARHVPPPPALGPDDVKAGFRIYESRCAICHGAPGARPSLSWTGDLMPPPPYLIGASRDWTRPELFWIVKHGVKMTGMPAWDRLCTDRQIWQVVAFLEALPKTTSAAYRDLRAESPPAAPQPAAGQREGCL